MSTARRFKRILALLLVLFMAVSMLPSTAVTDPLPASDLYKYESGSGSVQVAYGPADRGGRKEDTQAKELKFGQSGSTNKLKALSAALPFDTSKSALYKAVNLADLIDGVTLTTEQVARIRAILFETLERYDTRGPLKTAAGITGPGELNDNAVIGGVQTAIWRVLHNDGYIKTEGSSNSDSRRANTLATYLLTLSGMAGPESATPATASLRIAPIDEDSYNYSTPDVDVLVSYTLSGSGLSAMKLSGVPAGVTVKERVWVDSRRGGHYEYQNADLDNLTTDGKEHTLVLYKVSDVAALDLGISGTQNLGYGLQALVTPVPSADSLSMMTFGGPGGPGSGGPGSGGPGGDCDEDPDQYAIVNNLTMQTAAVSATAQMDLSTARGTLTIRKELVNTTASIGSFSLTAKGPFNFSETKEVAGNGSFVFEKVRYGKYTLKESGVGGDYLALDDDDWTYVTAAHSAKSMTVKNIKLGSITVVKNVTWSENDTTEFPIKLQVKVPYFGWQDVPFSKTTVSETASHRYSRLAAGKYRVVEDVSNMPEGYVPVKDMDEVTISINGSDIVAQLENMKLVKEITIEKTATMRGKVINKANPEDTITYKVVVSNTGNVDLTELDFDDSLVSVLGTVPASLDAGKTAKFDYTYKVPSAKYGELANTISVTTKEGASASSTAKVWVRGDADLDVVKNAPPVVLAGETINYDMDLYNNGNLDIVSMKYSDFLTRRNNVSLGDLTLAPDASEKGIDLGSITAPRYLEWVVNHVDVTGLWSVPQEDSTPRLTEEAGEPEQAADEQKPEEQKPDEQKPDEQKPDEQKPDEQKPDEQKPDEQKPDEQKPDEQKPDEQKPDEQKPDEDQPEEQQGDEPQEKAAAPVDGDSQMQNAGGRPPQNLVTADASAFTRVLQPNISIMKEVSEKYVLEDEVITYTLRVKNKGTAPLRDITITDAVLEAALGDDYNADDFAISALAPGKTVEKSFDVSVEALMTVTDLEDLGFDAETRLIKNQASVSGTAWREESEFTVDVDDNSECVVVKVLKPEITISKFILGVNPETEPTDDENTDDGDEDMGATALEALGGDMDAFTWHKPKPGKDPETKPVLPTGDETVDAYKGDVVRFGIVVTNTGEEVSWKDGRKTEKKGYDLTNLVLSDPLLGDTTWTIDSLKVGESFILTDLDYVVDPEDETSLDTILNTATVKGYPKLDESDDASIHVLKPAIELTKTADVDRIRRGGTLTYTFTIKNTGNVPLMGVTLTDPMFATDEDALGILLADGNLAAAEDEGGLDTITLTKTYTTTANGPLTNSATVTGLTLDERKEVSDTKSVTVTVYTPTRRPTTTTTTTTTTTEPEPELPAEEPVVVEEIPVAPLPESGDVVTPVEEPATPVAEIVMTEEVTPEGTPDLPKTGGVPMTLLFGIGTALSGTGLFLRRRKNRDEE